MKKVITRATPVGSPGRSLVSYNHVAPKNEHTVTQKYKYCIKGIRKVGPREKWSCLPHTSEALEKARSSSNERSS